MKKGNFKGSLKKEIISSFKKSWNSLEKSTIINSFLKSGYIGKMNEIYKNLYFNLKNTKFLDEYFEIQLNEYLQFNKKSIF